MTHRSLTDHLSAGGDLTDVDRRTAWRLAEAAVDAVSLPADARLARVAHVLDSVGQRDDPAHAWTAEVLESPDLVDTLRRRLPPEQGEWIAAMIHPFPLIVTEPESAWTCATCGHSGEAGETATRIGWRSVSNPNAPADTYHCGTCISDAAQAVTSGRQRSETGETPQLAVVAPGEWRCGGCGTTHHEDGEAAARTGWLNAASMAVGRLYEVHYCGACLGLAALATCPRA